MAGGSPHNKIINSIARAKLKPLGLLQKGRSRFWYEDRRWHVISIEFQPSGFSKGSYLNVSISWLWYPKDYLSFDTPHRGGSWVDFRDEDQFRQEFEVLADKAVELAREHRDVFGTLQSSYERLQRLHEDLIETGVWREAPRPGGWPDLHLGLLASLTGHTNRAEELLRSVVDVKSRVAWQERLNAFCEKGLGLLGNRDQFRDWVEANTAECRALLNLPALEAPVLPRE